MDNYKIIQERLLNKDKTVLKDLYETYGKKFYSYSIRNWDLSEDDSWEAVYKTLETSVLKLVDFSFDSQGHFDNYLFKIFVNYLRQAFRVKRKHQDHELEFIDFREEEIPDEIGHYLNNVSFTDYYKSEENDLPVLTDLKTALNELDEPERDLLLLRAQQYSYEEIADLLQIENNQLKVKYHRAKKKLFQVLQDKQLSRL